MNKYYTAGGLAKSGLLPYTTKDTIIKLINEGELKAMVRGSKEGTRYTIPASSVIDFLERKGL